jgi:hypothetical protein
MNYRIASLLTLFIFFLFNVNAQSLKPGFNAREYSDMLTLADLQYYNKDSVIEHYTIQYRSPEMGLKNRWDLWVREDNVGVISIRGTVQDLSSWLENFYSVMIPAKGSLQVSDSTIFNYQLAENPLASVHTGWTIGLAFLGPDIVDKIKRLRQEKDVREFIIFGHSQGGALAFLTTSYLYYLQKNGGLPSDLNFKSYCSAAPKPGNLYYAYDYDFITRGSKSFTIVNSDDWVPETPFSVQTPEDLNNINPFANINAVFAKQKMLARWYLKGMYNKMDKGSRKARDRYQKYLGKKLYPMVKKSLPQFKEPAYAGTMNYMRAGIPVILQTDSAYHEKFRGTKENVWIHHGLVPYKYLVGKIYVEAEAPVLTGN